MHRTDAADNDSGKFKESPSPASVFGYRSANAFQEEIAQYIESRGITLRASGADDEAAGYGGQLTDAVQDHIDSELSPVISNVSNNTTDISEINNDYLKLTGSATFQAYDMATPHNTHDFGVFYHAQKLITIDGKDLYLVKIFLSGSDSVLSICSGQYNLKAIANFPFKGFIDGTVNGAKTNITSVFNGTSVVAAQCIYASGASVSNDAESFVFSQLDVTDGIYYIGGFSDGSSANASAVLSTLEVILEHT